MSLSKTSNESATRLKYFWITAGALIPKVEGCERCQIEDMRRICFRNDSENIHLGENLDRDDGKGDPTGDP